MKKIAQNQWKMPPKSPLFKHFLPQIKNPGTRVPGFEAKKPNPPKWKKPGF